MAHSSEESFYTRSKGKERCSVCRWGFFKTFRDIFFRCRMLGRWTVGEYLCKYYKPYPLKTRRRGNCMYETEGKEYSHPKNCEKCLMAPDTCSDSPQYNPNWDDKRGEWRIPPHHSRTEGAIRVKPQRKIPHLPQIFRRSLAAIVWEADVTMRQPWRD